MPDTSDPGLSYRDAGVDIDAGDAVVAGIRSLTQGASHPQVLGGLGHFGGFYRVGATGGRATLVSSIDGVGTKLMIATLAGRFDTIGEDLVHHCVNDIVACGAEPLFFLDYYGTGRLNPDTALSVIGGMARACEAAGVALVGGETAEMPGLYSEEDFDLVGAIVGIVDEDRIIDGRAIRPNDLLVGLPSSGFHTNGYSLIRAALRLNEGEAARRRLQEPTPLDSSQSLADVLLRPHRSYLPVVRRLIDAGVVRGMAHITGGGLPGNVSRIVPDGLTAAIDTSSWVVPPVFEYVAEVGHISRLQCFRAFNMGIGFVLAVPPSEISSIISLVPNATVIGQILERSSDERVELMDKA